LDNLYCYSRESYKYFSALSPSGTVPSIGLNTFSDIIYNLQVIDYRTLKLSDVDLIFVSTLASGATYKSRMNPDRQLIRFQFLEILVRLAIEKYFKSSLCKTFDQAVTKFFEDHALPYFKQFSF
jgi:NLR family CARD domain-containing protein 3